MEGRSAASLPRWGSQSPAQPEFLYTNPHLACLNGIRRIREFCLQKRSEGRCGMSAPFGRGWAKTKSPSEEGLVMGACFGMELRGISKLLEGRFTVLELGGPVGHFISDEVQSFRVKLHHLRIAVVRTP